MKICKLQYRIVTDKYTGYECQIRFWYFPFWTQISINTNLSIEQAEEFIDSDRTKRNHKRKIVKTFNCG